ncbi:MAG: DNA-processing protein DprA [Planctomycetota bacterium]
MTGDQEPTERADEPAVLWSEDELQAANSELAGAPEWRRVPSNASSSRRASKNRVQRDPSIGWSREVSRARDGLAAEVFGQDKLDLLRLCMVPGIGPRLLRSLFDRFGESTAILKASSEDLAQVPGIGPKLIEQIKLHSRSVDLDHLVQWCQTHDTEIIFRGSEHYPDTLDDLDDAPPLLFVRGRWLPEDSVSVAIVGTRHATRYGIEQATKFAYSLARCGVTVISGLARGIDRVAHEGALDAGGRTIGVLGGGLGELYPPEHGPLAEAIAAHGAVISELPPESKPKRGHFPQRNRIVANLAKAVLVVEAPSKSGSLITARLAGEQNREVLAVPGQISSRNSRGCHDLIRDGAKLVQSIDDILEELGPLAEAVEDRGGHEVRNPIELKLNEVERKILDAVGDGGDLIDKVIAMTSLPAHQVTATITVLEMRRLVQRHPGGTLRRV